MNIWKSIILMMLMNFCYAADDSILGFWKTIDDVSGQPKAIIQIEQGSNQTISGHIVKLFHPTNEKINLFCQQCNGDKKNKPLIGMIILEQLKQSKADKNIWLNGKILDPHDGKTYQCNIQLAENGMKLNVRGYIGMPLFGRSQTWMRAVA